MRSAISSDDMITAEEALIADAQFVIHNLMEHAGITRADLARELGVSQSRVTQMFSDAAPNLTLRTLARIFRVLGEECRVTSDRWETLRANCSEAESVTESRTIQRPGQSDFVSMSELIEQLEGMSRSQIEQYSNDNARVIALAAMGRRRLAFPVQDRLVLRAGRIARRGATFATRPLLLALARSPTVWPRLLSPGAR